MSANRRLIRAMRGALRERADPAKAPKMRDYMKSAMPYLGVQTPLLRKACREVYASHAVDSFQEWRDTVLELWRKARYREERYAALELCAERSCQPFQTPKALPLYEELITTGAWWDYVDGIASHRLGLLLHKYPKAMTGRMRNWSRSRDLWKRRSSILCQLRFKEHTDLELLYACIEPSLESPEFFLRKAIGWALRTYAWTDPAEVIRYVRANADRLSPLSKREALKNLDVPIP